MKILIKEGYEIGKAIGGGKGDKWPIEIYQLVHIENTHKGRLPK